MTDKEFRSKVKDMKTGAQLITEERERQLQLGFDASHDDTHKNEALLHAARYCINGEGWPWTGAGAYGIFKKTRIRQLTIAGGLIAAEIDRLQRKNSKP